MSCKHPGVDLRPTVELFALPAQDPGLALRDFGAVMLVLGFRAQRRNEP